MSEANPVKIPADNYSNLTQDKQSKSAAHVPFKEAIGALLFLAMVSRPDIAYAVGVLSRRAEKPTQADWNAVRRIFKYLKGSTKRGLYFRGGRKRNMRLNAYSDSDFANDVQTRRSTTGYILKLNGNVICWGSRKQCTVALSTTEAEYIAASVTVQEIIWAKRLISELLRSDREILTKLFVDNQSAIKLIKNPQFHRRTKHIDVRHHFIREKYKEKCFELNYIESKRQQADIFTKALPIVAFENLCKVIGIRCEK